ncbi:Na(+)/H(+) antiporter subunit F1 [Ornithinibacillus halophilus]|uniref:Multisubunit sodium/proton antiporter, MrpF subunit n=1 Tax=Ornithinibacillus halophilus TaxID=930117 RepID=A0A1M5DJM0_9BACI|nr:Na(+)/H(+) antiporter subunit F1 [Ornithinibacillus halophilus]SHF67084.1 multisubunit sodium/proton antiporter, MrpF subunit [Ornithinibacillus halophilus]
MTDNLLDVTETILDITLFISFIAISLSLILLLIRMLKGPTNPDRAVALDTIGINLMGVAALLAIYLITPNLNDVILLIAILAFLGTVAIAKYLEKGVIIDRDMD